ncbi:MAG: hypothetical protein IIA05_03065 [Proteobacteria bacterium]|nr:hypothetical protein [Pseudomonadota bacterium]
MDKPEMMNPPAAEQINEVAAAMRKAIVVYFDAGYSPGTISGGLMVAIYNLMKAQEMSEMKISNELYRIVDGVRELAFLAFENSNE